MQTELSAPECFLIVRGQEIRGVTGLVVTSSRLTPVDVADIEGDESTIYAAGMSQRVEVWLGYRGLGRWRIFQGQEDQPATTKGGRRRLRLADPLAKGRWYPVTRAFRGVSPQELVAPLFAEAHLPLMTSAAALDRRDFTCMGDTLLQVAIQARMLWDLDWDLYHRPTDGLCYWMPWAESPAAAGTHVTVFEYGKNILSHHLNLTGGVIETVAMPWVEHSARVRIVDPRYFSTPKTVRVDRVTHTYDGKKARMTVEWSDLPPS